MIQQTSLSAYRGIEKELGKRESEVYAVIMGSGDRGVTNLEISRTLCLPINRITGRTRTLVQKGMVISESVRRDPLTLKKGMVWRVIK